MPGELLVHVEFVCIILLSWLFTYIGSLLDKIEDGESDWDIGVCGGFSLGVVLRNTHMYICM